jgi:hypothetical protein
MGALLVYSLWFLRRHPGEAKELFKSILKREVQLLFTLAIEWWDFAGDCIVFRGVMLNRKSEEVYDLVVPYCIFFGVSCLVSVYSMFFKFRLFIEFFQKRRNTDMMASSRLPPAGADDDKSADPKLPLKGSRNWATLRLMLLRQNIEDNEKECKLTYIDLLLGMLEDIPMGVLNFLYILRRVDAKNGLEALVLFSLVTSCVMLGVKLAKALKLRILWPQREEWKEQEKGLIEYLDSPEPDQLQKRLHGMGWQADLEQKAAQSTLGSRHTHSRTDGHSRGANASIELRSVRFSRPLSSSVMPDHPRPLHAWTDKEVVDWIKAVGTPRKKSCALCASRAELGAGGGRGNGRLQCAGGV